jgi:hypothetical protein
MPTVEVVVEVAIVGIVESWLLRVGGVRGGGLGGV